MSPEDCCVLNSGSGAWGFEPLAIQLSRSLGIDVSDEPRRFNYLLHIENLVEAVGWQLFIPLAAMLLASDKRSLARVFREHQVPTPETRLLDTYAEVQQFIRAHADREWCLKFPTSCGASGHRLISDANDEPPNWPRPFIVQEFIRLERPEVYRNYCAAGELFGWVARRFPEGTEASPWVAHARGARYANAGGPPAQALEAARCALVATRLWDSFGCADLLRKPTGEWVVLEVGTDGLFNHVDRELGDAELERQLRERVADAFWKAAQQP
jgi:glutathione synthase/RimK-type ligase-like ATP-grasp enzyme